MISDLSRFENLIAFDFEFSTNEDRLPVPHCLVFKELNTGLVERVFFDNEESFKTPYDCSDKSLFIAYFASAEIGCHLALDWPIPENILDLYVEFRALTNGKALPFKKGLLGALTYFGFGGIHVEEKEEMRQLAMRGGPFTKDEKSDLLDYCQTDVAALEYLVMAMAPRLQFPFPILRGSYMACVARMERNGIPVDHNTYQSFVNNWQITKEKLISEVDKDFDVFERGSFRQTKFRNYLQKEGITWPKLPSGKLKLDDDTFRDMSKTFPQIAPLRELRSTLSQGRVCKLPLGADGHNRCLLSPFSSRTSRNQPSNSEFIFGQPKWSRNLIVPKAGMGLAYLDYEQQEFGIAAALSGDENMKAAYRSGDPYLSFAIQAGLVPENATKSTHPLERDRCKICVLAVQYGMTEHGLAPKLGCSEIEAKDLLNLHKATYPRFWEWSKSVVLSALTNKRIYTAFGWELTVTGSVNHRMLANFPMQANGAEMLRLAIIRAVELGVDVCAPVHDAILIQAPLEDLSAAVAATQEALRYASTVVLDGFELRSDVLVRKHPERFLEVGESKMWETIISLLPKGEDKHVN